MRWRGFRKVRGQVLKRVKRRIVQLGLDGFGEYHDYLASHPDEWKRLDVLCRITISRFYRDRGVFDFIGAEVLPLLAQDAARDGRSLRCWTAGCASGEETFTLAILCEVALAERFGDVGVEIIATDADRRLLDRAAEGRYPAGCVRGLPAGWLERGFEPAGESFCVRERYGRNVTFLEQDLREGVPPGPFDLVMCRNLAFTYFDAPLQVEIARAFREALRPGGALVLGKHERLPGDHPGFELWHEHNRVYRRAG